LRGNYGPYGSNNKKKGQFMRHSLVTAFALAGAIALSPMTQAAAGETEEGWGVSSETSVEYDEFGNLLSEEYRRDGQLDREDGGPAVIRYDPQTGGIVREAWFHDGKLDRDDGPAEIVRDSESGKILRAVWRRDGKMHRVGKPAEIDTDIHTGTVTYEAWWRRGLLHHLGGPAIIERDPATGVVTREEWYRDGDWIEPPLAQQSRVPAPF
jgi:hypothetical protein